MDEWDSRHLISFLWLRPGITLFGIGRLDPATYAAVAVVLAAVAALASYAPARRAAAVDPVEALRAE